MTNTNTPAFKRKSFWGWCTLVAVALLFIINNALPYFNLNSTVYKTEQIRPFAGLLLIHIAGGMVALLIGPFQFAKTVRQKYPATHRLLGKTYIVAILISSTVSILLSVFHAILHRGYVTFGVGLLGLAAAWLTTTLLAFWSIRNKNIEQHREWMIRSYVVTCGFITFRVAFGLLEFVLHVSHVDSGNIAAWFSWSIPLLICEVFLQAGKMRRISH